MTEPYQPRRAPTHERIVVRGLAHHLTRWPGSEPRPVLLLHGWADAGATFQFLADALPRQRTLVAPDWRGFGDTAWPEDGYWFPEYYADLESLLDTLSPDEPATLIGHSMGGNIAMTYAGIRPERVRAVVSIDAFGLQRTRAEQAPGRYRAWLAQLRETPAFARFPSFDAFAAFLARRNPRLPPAHAAFIARCWAEPAPDGGVRMKADPRHKRINPVLYRREEAEACWRGIRAPLLFVVAAGSEMLARFGDDADLGRLRDLVPGLESVVIEDAGHMLHHERPRPLAQAIERFLAAQDARMHAPR